MNAKDWFDKGNELFDLGKYEEAIQCYDIAIEINPDFEEAYYNKGTALSDLGNKEEAIKCYDKAIELNPDLEKAYNNKGVALSDLGKNEEAIQCYDKAIEINPNYANAYNCRGNAYEKLNEKHKAITDWLTCLYFSIKQNNIKYIHKLLQKSLIDSPDIRFLEAYPQNIQYIFEELKLNNSYLLHFQSTCSLITDFDLLLNFYAKTKKLNDRELLSTKALLYYYLGGNVHSFHIYDDLLDDGTPFSAQELYYYALTAIEIGYYEAKTILNDNIRQLEEKSNKKDEDYYYLGHLYLLNEENEKAKEQFNKSSDNKFSAIMLKDFIEKEDFKLSALSGEIDLTEGLSQFDDYFHFRECCDVNMEYQELWEAFAFKNSFNGNVNIAARKLEADIIIEKLANEYENNIRKWFGNLSKEDEKRLPEITKQIENSNFFPNETPEYKIALYICDLTITPIKYYLYYIYYKYKCNKLEAKQAFYLILFLRCRINDKTRRNAEESISKILLSKYNIGKFIAMAKALVSLLKEEDELRKEIEKDNDNKNTYIGFKEDTWKTIRFDYDVFSSEKLKPKPIPENIELEFLEEFVEEWGYFGW